MVHESAESNGKSRWKNGRVEMRKTTLSYRKNNIKKDNHLKAESTRSNVKSRRKSDRIKS